MEEKNALVAQIVCLQMLDYKTTKSNSEVSKSNSNIFVQETISVSKTTLLQREPFLTKIVLYYQKLSIAHYQESFMPTIILSNYQ